MNQIGGIHIAMLPAIESQKSLVAFTGDLRNPKKG